MKTLYNNLFLGLLTVTSMISCNENEFLKEEPVDLYTAETVYSTPAGIEGVLVNLYVKERDIYYSGRDVSYTLLYGADTFFNARGFDGSREKISDLSNSLSPVTYPSEWFYQENFKLIAAANLVITNVAISKLSDSQKALASAEAKFFRAKAYRDLVYLYGGVPLITAFPENERYDYVRATRQEVLNQIESDFRDAATFLPAINVVKDGRVSNIVASFYLGETLISQNKYPEAVAELTKVTADPNVRLMTARFGSRMAVPGKDIFWDLWQRGNQNRTSGNRESLWVCQFETDVPGGVLKSNNREANVLERFHIPAVWSMQDPLGVVGFEGRKTGDNVGGAGTSFLQPTPYTTNSSDMIGGGIWPAGYVGDMRCNNNNLIKDCVFDNPASTFVGQRYSTVLASGRRGRNHGITPTAGAWRFYPWFVKATTPNDHPAGLADLARPQLLSGAAGATYHDTYYLRLPEAFLLKAEANLLAGNLQAAADDINVVRRRAGATNVLAADVTIDYILDERTREINLEEQRQITLRRVGKYGERLVKYNSQTAPSYNSKFDLFPIPLKEIESNTEAKLEQNPGY